MSTKVEYRNYEIICAIKNVFLKVESSNVSVVAVISFAVVESLP